MKDICEAKRDKETVYSQRDKGAGQKSEKKPDACARGEQRVGTAPGLILEEVEACERVVITYHLLHNKACVECVFLAGGINCCESVNSICRV